MRSARKGSNLNGLQRPDFELGVVGAADDERLGRVPRDDVHIRRVRVANGANASLRGRRSRVPHAQRAIGRRGHEERLFSVRPLNVFNGALVASERPRADAPPAAFGHLPEEDLKQDRVQPVRACARSPDDADRRRPTFPFSMATSRVQSLLHDGRRM